MKKIRNQALAAAASLMGMTATVAADDLQAMAEINGCTDPGISGNQPPRLNLENTTGTLTSCTNRRAHPIGSHHA